MFDLMHCQPSRPSSSCRRTTPTPLPLQHDPFTLPSFIHVHPSFLPGCPASLPCCDITLDHPPSFRFSLPCSPAPSLAPSFQLPSCPPSFLPFFLTPLFSIIPHPQDPSEKWIQHPYKATRFCRSGSFPPSLLALFLSSLIMDQ